MCDRHDKKELDHYCIEHEEIVCEQCATENHAQTPCQSMLLVLASKHVNAKLEAGVFEIKKLKKTSQSILDGTRLDDTMRTVHEAEEMLDTFVEKARKKIDHAKSLLRPFSELSREELWKLKTIATKKIPSEAPVRSSTTDIDEARDLVTRFQEIRKQSHMATEVLNALPSYVDVSINPDFTDLFSFDGQPVLLTRKGDVLEEDDEFLDGAPTTTSLQETVRLVEKSHFSLDHCSDIALLDDCMVVSVCDSVQKRDRKRMSFRQALTLPGAGKLCVIGATTEVSVLQKAGFITIFETDPDLRPLYRLMTEIRYYDMCYFKSTQGDIGCPKQSPVYVVCYTNRDAFSSRSSDCIDIVQAKRTKYPGRLPAFNLKSTTIADSAFGKSRSRFVGARSVSALQGRFIIIGAKNGVTCIDTTGELKWTVNTNKPINHLMTYRSLLFVCTADERNIMVIGKQGHVMEENVLPPVDIFPQKLCAYEEILMVKYMDKDKWIVFKKI